MTTIGRLAAAVVVAAMAGPALAKTKAESAKAATVTGEVIDVSCYLMEGAKGDDHKGCATKCIENGMPVGILTDQGEVILAITADHASAKGLLLPYVAQRVTVTGTLNRRAGTSLIQVADVKVAPAKAEKTGKAAGKQAKATWVCPMGCSKADHPGKCPVCGMEMVKAK